MRKTWLKCLTDKDCELMLGGKGPAQHSLPSLTPPAPTQAATLPRGKDS